MTLPLPRFYDPAQVGSVYIERAGMIADAATEYAKQHAIKPSATDKFRIAAFGIDCQIGFCTPGASLFVPGAVDDTQRTIEWLYRHMDRLTGLHFSMDTHRVFQIFHPAWWIDAQGNHPAPMTTIAAEDVRTGKWQAIAHPKEAYEYCTKLEKGGRYLLTIWPFHTLLGGVSHAMVPALMEAAIFHSIARTHQTHFETKGTHAMTENYSVLSPEVKELGGQVVGGFNAPFFKLLMDYDRIYVFGQAKSHCVMSTLQDLQDTILATDPALADKIWILEDAMSPVPAPPLTPLPAFLDFPVIADKAIEGFRKIGMHVVKTTDPIA
ncbi:MAG: nicotinamidase [Candidatus Sericytochromatia bacterium]|nr:nicotinamidase [Candidatus Sericytochromatia bacterium]